MRINLHIYDSKAGEDALGSRTANYIPRVGEYLDLSPTDSSWLKVQLVVYRLYPGETNDIEADVYGEKVERADAIKASEYKGKL